MAQCLTDPELQRRFGAQAMDLRSSTGPALMELAARDRVKWGRIVAAQGIKPER